MIKITDVIYKRNFYDKICRGIVGAGLLYIYTKSIVNIDNYRDSRKSEYKIMQIAGQDVLMYKKNEQIVKIDKNWFISNTNNLDKTIFVKSIDDAIKNIDLK